jgi:competence protein ComFB
MSAGVFEIPAIVGRLYNGQNFEPMSDVTLTLLEEGVEVPMQDNSFTNPCALLPSMEGVFTFWPKAVPCLECGEEQTFQYTLQAEAPDMEPLFHYFEITVTSQRANDEQPTLRSTFKIGSLYMFPNDGEADKLEKYVISEDFEL